MLTFIPHIEVYFTFAFLAFYVCVLRVRYNEDFVKSRFCSSHFIAILAGLKKVDRCTEDFLL